MYAGYVPRSHANKGRRTTQGEKRKNMKQRLTEEQDRRRLKGLRILARIIVRAHLTSQLNGNVGMKDPRDDSTGDSVVHGVHGKELGDAA